MEQHLKGLVESQSNSVAIHFAAEKGLQKLEKYFEIAKKNHCVILGTGTSLGIHKVDL